MLKILTVLCLSGALSCFASANMCAQLFSPLSFTPSHFASSTFGLVHAERPGQARYSQWSADTANEVLLAIAAGKPAKELFEIGVRARQEFARKFENVDKSEEDFGASRVTRSRNIVGEDMIGLSSLTLDRRRGQALPAHFDAWPNPWWANIARTESRTQLADSILIHLVETQRLSTTDYNLLIWDRFYQTSTGEVLKSSSTKIQRAFPEQQDSPYFVSTLNAPKPEIELLMTDVYRRIQLALKAPTKKEARENLSHAMYGFFNAMPYYRGSAAIGRIVFTVLFSSIEERPMIIDPECDVKALVQSQFEFLTNIQSIVRTGK
ncbi:MAG TPA: hypothetical protein VIG33_12370 [Pseudobdellovibrionaceae bacterium]|jgi:hypothetical protein